MNRPKRPFEYRWMDFKEKMGKGFVWVSKWFTKCLLWAATFASVSGILYGLWLLPLAQSAAILGGLLVLVMFSVGLVELMQNG